VKTIPDVCLGFPNPSIGSSSAVGLDHNICFERHGRFAPYGIDHLSIHEHPPSSVVDWDKVRWGKLQQTCVNRNRELFDLGPRSFSDNKSRLNDFPGRDARHRKRVAVIFRSYDGMQYNADMLRTMRAVISELSLGSGGEYVAFLLVQVKDQSLPIFDDPELYEKIIREKVPKEFWDITVLWSEAIWPQLYPSLPQGAMNVHLSQWLPIQWFAMKYNNFDHYWNWEMDVRYTGHYYELVEALHSWTQQQPRKGLWERNSRFWIPSIHGSLSSFMNSVQQKYVKGKLFQQQDRSIWGPQLYPDQERFGFVLDPPYHKPTALEDDFEWGVGEDADLITLLPMFNPDPTHYVFRDAYWNYPTTSGPAGPPRRTSIITFFRLSHRLLNLMHLENSRTLGHHMGSETWPQSVTLQHGLKAVHVPHSIYMEKAWPPEALDFIFNNGDRERTVEAFKNIPDYGEGSGGYESPFGLGREHNFDQSTWYYRDRLASRLYRRFLGHEVDGIGGKDWEKQHGTFCLPPMLLHPIEALDDPVVEHDPPVAT
jgi:hypothetical protein